MAKPSEGTRTVSMVDGNTVVELVYDPAKRQTAFAVARDGSWTIEQEAETAHVERLVPYPATNNLIAHACVLLPSVPVDHGSKAALVRDIEAYLHRHVDLPPLFERIAAHYVLLSWVFDAFNELPYLRFRGDYGSGKTRALIALGSIAYRGFFASGASTVSPVFHTLDAFGGTLVLDEGDLRFSGKTADLVKILNNGTVKGLPVLRSVQDRNKEYNPAAFRVFGPKIVAMRGSFRDQALESRFITAEMQVRQLRPDIPIQLPASLQGEALELRNRLLHFRLTQRFAIASKPERVIAGVDPRLNQTALSLLSMIDDASLREEIAALLREKQVQLAAARANAAATRTMAILKDALREPGRRSMSLRELADRLNDSGGSSDLRVSPRELGQTLRELAVPLRKSHGNTVVPLQAVGTLAPAVRPPNSAAADASLPVRQAGHAYTLR